MTAHRHGPRRHVLGQDIRVVCDACGDPWPLAMLSLYRRYAICTDCIGFVRYSDAVDGDAAANDPEYALARREFQRQLLADEGPYTSSARVVRSHFKLDSAGAAGPGQPGESLVRGEP